MDRPYLRQHDAAATSSGRRPIGFIAKLVLAVLIATAFGSTGVGFAQQASTSDADKKKADAKLAAEQKTSKPSDELSVEKAGIRVGLKISSMSQTAERKQAGILEGDEVYVSLTVSDSAGEPLSGLYPMLWLDLRVPSETPTADSCRMKVQAFLQGSLRARPTIDLNLYYVLTLNTDGTINVIDPQFGYGDSKLYEMIQLPAPGYHWVLSDDRKQLFVSMSSKDQVAVVDTTPWALARTIPAGTQSEMLALAPDQHYLWVTNRAEGPAKSGVTIIDRHSLKIQKFIPTGSGSHRIAFDRNSSHAFVSNSNEGTVMVIDARKLEPVRQLKLASEITDATYPPHSNAFYVLSARDEAVIGVSATTLKQIAQLPVGPGTAQIRFEPQGRWGFVTAPEQDAVYIFDTVLHQIRYKVPVPGGPTEVAFTDSFAYVRPLDDPRVFLIRLEALGKPKALKTIDFPAGQTTVREGGGFGPSPTVVPAVEFGAAVVSNRFDHRVYHYHEGMAAPKGGFNNYGKEPINVLVADMNLRERLPGVYSTTTYVEEPGNYDVVLFIDTPRVIHCFDLAVKPAPLSRKRKAKREYLLEVPERLRTIPAAQEIPLRFWLYEKASRDTVAAVKDVEVMVMNTVTTWLQFFKAEPQADGSYEARISVPEAGVYFTFVRVPSLGINFNELPYLVFSATAPGAPITETHSRGQGGTNEQ